MGGKAEEGRELEVEGSGAAHFLLRMWRETCLLWHFDCGAIPISGHCASSNPNPNWTKPTPIQSPPPPPPFPYSSSSVLEMEEQ